MQVKLLHSTPLVIDAIACRTCWGSHGNSDTETTACSDSYGIEYNIAIEDQVLGPEDAKLIEKVGNKFKHKSILEHVSYNFYISGVSRALLQELARHRTAKLSVKSSRYTLKELKHEPEFNDFSSELDFKRAQKYLVQTGNTKVDEASFYALEELRVLIKSGISNDLAKYAMPECYKTELTWTMDARNLQSFLNLRSNKGALWEIRELAHALYKELPYDHQYLFQDYINPVVARPTSNK